MTDQEVIKQERKATADLYLKQAAQIETMKKVLKSFVDNFEACEACGGTGIHDDGVSACPDCGGTALQIVSRGLLLSELYHEAAEAVQS